MRFFLFIIGLSLIFFSCQQEVILSESQEDVIYIRRDGADMPAYVYGNALSKTFILMVHGGPGGNGLEYRSGVFEEELEKDYAIVYWDQRGQGSAHGSFGDAELTIASMVEDLHLLVRSLKARYGEDIKIFLTGHSWGGMLTASYMVTADYQSDITAWIEIDGAHDIPLLNKEAIKMFRQIGQEQLDAGKNTDRWQEIFDFATGVDTNNISVNDGGQINGYGFEAEGLLEEIKTPEGGGKGIYHFLFGSPTNPLTSGLTGNVTSNGLLEEIEKTSRTNELNKITMPSLFLWGKYDFVVPPALAASAYNEISSTEKEIVIFDHSGHSPMDNEPTEFLRAMREFIERYR